MAAQNKPVKLLSSVPAVAVDGHGIGIDPNTGVGNLVFIQLVMSQTKEQPKDKELEGNVVSSVRLSLEQLEGLNTALTNAIKNYKNTKKETKK